METRESFITVSRGGERRQNRTIENSLPINCHLGQIKIISWIFLWRSGKFIVTTKILHPTPSPTFSPLPGDKSRPVPTMHNE